MKITCRGCGIDYPVEKFPHRCLDCGDLFTFQDGLNYLPGKMDQELEGIWRYRHSFSLPEGAPEISLGEGDTPLVWCEAAGINVGFKLESLNPTGSFKDRGTAVLISWLLAAGVNKAVEDSSGNAGASFAAYASRVGIKGKVFIPSSATGPKRTQIENYGGEVISVPGPRKNAAAAVLQEVKKGAVYASHAYLPHGTAGIATIAYELVEGSRETPGTIVLPVGHGSLLLGIARGFDALYKTGQIARLPRLVGVQAASCAPLSKAFDQGSPDPIPVDHKNTIAEGVAITEPYHGREVLAAVKRSEGLILKSEEEEIMAGHKALAEKGFYVEHTSALVYSGLEHIAKNTPEPIIAIISGHGLKSG
jgi:threonine synthase